MCSGGGGGNTTTVQSADPWSGVQKYLAGNAENPTMGIFPQAERMYSNNGWTPNMDAINNQNKDQMGRMINDPHYQNIWEAGNDATRGSFDPNITPVDPITGKSVDPTQAFSSMGAADPTQSIQQMLSGQVNTSALDPVVSNAMRRMNEGFNEQVMPGIGHGAVSSGQYGGSRQGIAEGLAKKGLAYSMGDTTANMYNNAFNNAQQNMYGTANSMAGLGMSNAAGNADRDVATQQFNANLGMANNAQEMQRAAQSLGNVQAGADLTNAGILGQQNSFDNQLRLENKQNEYDWNNLKNYAGVVYPGAGLGGTSSSTTPLTQNKTAGAMGGALAGGMLGTAASGLIPGMGAGGVGAGILPGLGALGGLLMSDRRYKKNITRVGTLDNGLDVYTFQYVHGGPVTMGVMADEAKKYNPEAVETHNGVDYVNYGRL